MSEAVGTQLVEDGRQHVRDLLVLGVTRDGERVGLQRRLHLRIVEVDHSAVIFDHIHLQPGNIVVKSLVVKPGKTHLNTQDNSEQQRNTLIYSYLFNTRNVADRQFLQGILQLFIIRGGGFVNYLPFPPGHSFASHPHLLRKLSKLVFVHDEL